MTEPGDSSSTLRVSRRSGDRWVGVRCAREFVGGEVSSSDEARSAVIGGVDAVLVTENVHSMATCEGEGDETERCEFATTIAYVFDPDLRFIGDVLLEKDAEVRVEGGVLLVGDERRVIRDGALVVP